MSENSIFREKIVFRIAFIGFFANVILMISKLWIGYLAYSTALFAEGINSATDVFSSLMVLSVIKIASKPADDEHPYGHGKAEIIVSLFVGIIIAVVSIYLLIETFASLVDGVETAPESIAMYVALFSFIIKIILYSISMKIAKKYHSKAIEAVAYDHKSDIISSIAVVVGIYLSILSEKMGWNFLLYGDQIASLFVVYLLFKISKKIIIDALHLLLDRSVEKNLMEQFQDIIMTFSDVERIDKLRARESGHNIYIDLRISIRHNMTIKEGHDLSREIKQTLIESNTRIVEVLIHLNPYFRE